jgi:polyphosphate glucokinase
MKPAAGGLTLCVDIGGSHIKASVVDCRGAMVCEAVATATPKPASPARVIAAIAALAARLPAHGRISAGFPGVVRHGEIVTAPNLGTKLWHGFDLAHHLTRKLKKPARVLNDAEVQGLGTIFGKGLECVVTLGTGFGSALFRDGELMPHLELGQHPVWKGKTYDQYLGQAALSVKGPRKWNRRLERALGFLATLINYDRLYLGGGNARKVTLRLPSNVERVANEAGITGGARLWHGSYDEIFAEVRQRDRPVRR